jgi:lipopolysaccharide/colanic/teichoic acid biosynthesis glycosyltransferase
MKRLTDLLLSSTLVAGTIPLWLFAACWIKIHDRGPVFYRAPRVGRNGRPFMMYKFRTMVINADRVGASSTTLDDPRITAVGRWMRRWKVDELPQLLNVLSGDMSIVGPRPQVQWAVDRYSAEERSVLTVRPGMTDWASIVFSNEGEILQGHPDPDEAYMRLIHPTKMRLAMQYVAHPTLWIDLRILWGTAAALVGKRPDPNQILGSR